MGYPIFFIQERSGINGKFNIINSPLINNNLSDKKVNKFAPLTRFRRNTRNNKCYQRRYEFSRL